MLRSYFDEWNALSGRFRSRNINMTVRLGQYELPLGIRNCKAVAKGDRFWMFDFTLFKSFID